MDILSWENYKYGMGYTQQALGHLYDLEAYTGRQMENHLNGVNHVAMIAILPLQQAMPFTKQRQR